MTVYRTKATDSGSVLRATLDGVDLTEADSLVVVLRPNGELEGGGEIELDAVIAAPETSDVQLVIRDTHPVARGDYYMRWRAFFPGGTVLTIPSEGSDYLLVTA
jgi:hypothetical protein